MTPRQRYIATHATAAIEACKEYPSLFPSVLIAQAILESGNGKSQLASKYNNHFGIKASKGWTGRVVSLKTKEVYDSKEVTVVDGFRVYDSTEHSFRDRNRFLARNRRYTTNGVFSAPTPQAQAKALQKAGYATDPNYADKLIALVEREGLTVYDVLDNPNVPTVNIGNETEPIAEVRTDPSDTREHPAPDTAPRERSVVVIDQPDLIDPDRLLDPPATVHPRPPVTPPPIPIPTALPRKISIAMRILSSLIRLMRRGT